MFVKQLIGRQANMVIDMPFAEAKACIDNGTAVQATQEEITAAMEQSSAPVVAPPNEVLLAGYRVEPSEKGGYDVFDAGGVKISDSEKQPLRNQLEAREFVLVYSRRVRGLPEPTELGEAGGNAGGAGDDDNYKDHTVEELQKMAADRGLETSGATKKADWVRLLDRDDKVKKALADGEYEVLTVAELQKLAADRRIDLGDAKTKVDIVEKIKGEKAAA